MANSKGCILNCFKASVTKRLNYYVRPHPILIDPNRPISRVGCKTENFSLESWEKFLFCKVPFHIFKISFTRKKKLWLFWEGLCNGCTGGRKCLNFLCFWKGSWCKTFDYLITICHTFHRLRSLKRDQFFRWENDENPLSARRRKKTQDFHDNE